MSRTITDTVQLAARKLGILGTGQTLESDYQADLVQAYAEVHAELEAQGKIDFGPAANIPNRFADIFACMVAHKRLAVYKPPPERQAQIENDYAGAMRKYFAIRQRGRSGQTEIENY